MSAEINPIIPIASHGKHKHSINTPTLVTHNFFEMFPIFNKNYRVGEKCNFDIPLFGRTEAFVQAAMMTGRYVVRKFFVPHRLVQRSYQNVMEKSIYTFPDGTSGYINEFRYVLMSDLTTAIVNSRDFTDVIDPVSGDFIHADIIASIGSEVYYRNFTPLGRQVIRILNSLGISPTWDDQDNRPVKILWVLEYLRLYLDWIWPSTYVGNVFYNRIDALLKMDGQTSFEVPALSVLNALKQCIYGFYDQSIMDYAFDHPVAGNVTDPGFITLNDVSGSDTQVVAGDAANNGTPTAILGKVPEITQYVLDSLQSVNNYVKRHQLAGASLINRFYADRGIKLPSILSERSLLMGEDSRNLRVGDVENNSDSNLGELAGKGVVSDANNSPIHVEETFSDDGTLFVVLVAVPDAPYIMYNHPDVFAVHSEDVYHAEFDKLGAEAVPSSVMYVSRFGDYNRRFVAGSNRVFGFLPRYYADVYNGARLLGDFRLSSRGSESLNKFHSFRLLPEAFLSNGINHSFDFINPAHDAIQFQRFFNSETADNLITLFWFQGDSYQDKLPLGDSYDWDEDADNKRVQIALKH